MSLLGACTNNTTTSAGTTSGVTTSGTSTGTATTGGAGGPGGSGGGTSGGGGSSSVTYTAVNEYSTSATVTGATIASTGTDEEAVLVDNSNANVLLDGCAVSRNSASSTGGDNSSFYGVGADALVTSGKLFVKGGTYDTSAKGGAGVFAYDGGAAYVKDATISTSLSTSGGVHVAGGGTLYGWDNTVTTQGESSAAVRSDRGGGTMRLSGGTYTSNGTGSPAVYCTADIEVSDATLISNGSEALCLEGKNSTSLFNCSLTGNMPLNSQNEGLQWNVIVYQSMSGDSATGTGNFSMVGGSLEAKTGGMLYTTNTASEFLLDGVTIANSDADSFLMRCTGNSNSRGWGTTGSNGATTNFTAVAQAMEGKIVWDYSSKLDTYLTQGSTWTGASIIDTTDQGSATSGHGNLVIDSTSKWVVSADSVLTSLENAGTIVDPSGNAVTIKVGDTVKVNGTSAYTITCGSYSTTTDTSGALSVPTAETMVVPSQLS
jgi:hypothetical protein